jgi:hypothetical protein
MYPLSFNSNTGEVYVCENFIEYKLSSFFCEDDEINNLNSLSDDSFIDFDDEKVFLFNVVFIGEIFNLSMIYNEKKLRLINFKLVYESYDEFDLKMNGLVGYFDKTQFLNKKVDDVKPYTEYFYNWGVVSVYSDLSLNIYFSVRWREEC